MRIYRSYKFTNKHHSAGGIRSSIAAALSLVCTAACIAVSYLQKGNGAEYLVIPGAVAILSAVYGLFEGNQSFKEEECYYLFSRIGTVSSLLLVIGWTVIVGMGIML